MFLTLSNDGFVKIENEYLYCSHCGGLIKLKQFARSQRLQCVNCSIVYQTCICGRSSKLKVYHFQLN